MIKPKVTLERSRHKEVEVVKILFEKNEEILRCLRPLPNLRWSQTLRSWYAPFRNTLVKDVFVLLKTHAFIDYSLLKKTDVQAELRPAVPDLKMESESNSLIKQFPALSSDREEKIKAFMSWMRSRRYSENTITTYSGALTIFVQYFRSHLKNTYWSILLRLFHSYFVVFLVKRCSAIDFEKRLV